MNQLSRRQNLAIVLQLATYANYVLACIGALWLASDHSQGLIEFTLHGGLALDLGCMVVLALGVLGPLMSLSTPHNRLRSEWFRVHAALRDAAVATGIAAIGGVLLDKALLIDRVFLVSFFGLLVVLPLLTRALVYRTALLLRRRDRNLRHVILVGSGPRAHELFARVQDHPELGYRVLGYVDDDHHACTVDAPKLGNLADFEKVVDSHQVDEIFLALPMRSLYDAIVSISAACEIRGIHVHLLADLFVPSVARAEVQALDNQPLMSLISSGPMGGIAYLGKRAIDRIGGLGLLIVTAPVLALISLGILVTMGRPIFFLQPRVGYQRRVFNVMKFRTMVKNAEALMADLEEKNEMDGAAFKLREDPRVTKFGSFLRRYSLDELPQIINVVAGDMSLVGPRPLPLRDVALFDRPDMNRRFAVWPGITCTWQISGRNDISFDDWIKLDLEYVDNWTLGRDCEILLRTLPAVISRKGAY